MVNENISDKPTINEDLTKMVREYCVTGNQLGKTKKENKAMQVIAAEDQIKTTLGRMVMYLHDENPALDPGRTKSEAEKLTRKQASASVLNDLIWKEAKKTVRGTTGVEALYPYQPPTITDELKISGRGRWG